MKLSDLIPAGAKVRTIGLYQPYATLMLNGKDIETRWVREGKRAPFPNGWYAIYSTRKAFTSEGFREVAGRTEVAAKRAYLPDPTHKMNGFIIGVGFLEDKIEWTPMMMDYSFVDQRHAVEGYTLWALNFTKIHRVDPVPFKGKQGVGFLPDVLRATINVGIAV